MTSVAASRERAVEASSASAPTTPGDGRVNNFRCDFSTKTIVVTGGARGIGAGVVDAFLTVHRAKRVYSVSRSTPDGVVPGSNGRLIGISADLSTEGGVGRVKEVIGDEVVHVCIHNSGTSWGEALETHDGWSKTMDLNVVGTFRLTRALLPNLIQGSRTDDPARVIIIGSIAGIRPQKYPTFSYDASKAALHHLALKLADEFASARKLDITVNVIAPGYIPTKMSAQLSTYGESQDEIVKQSVPLRRAGAPQDVADACAFLASSGASWITGVVLPIDGGFLAKL